MPAQTSPFSVNTSTGGILPNADNIKFNYNSSKDASETARGILEGIGWRPTVTFDDPLYPQFRSKTDGSEILGKRDE